MKKMMSAAAVAALMMFAGAASAQQAYVGGTIGFSNFSVDCPGGTHCDTSDTAFKLYGGYTVAPHVAIELAYIDFGSTTSTTNLLGLNYYTVDTSAFIVNGAYRWDFSPKWTGVARLGLASVSSDLSAPLANDSKSAMKLYAGVGIEYNFSKNLKAVGAFDLTSFEVGNSDGSLNSLSGGIQFSF